MSNLKKALYFGASAALVLSSMGGVLTASAVTISDGDLVKVAGSPAVYYIQGATKRVFPHANVYLSWGYPSNYSTVKTVTATDLAAYSDGNAMPFRDGSLFRGTSSGIGGYAKEAVYFVQGATLRPVVSSAVYQALFKDPNWLKVTWVPSDLLDKFTYPLGDLITSSTTHSDGSLVRYDEGGTIYLISGGVKRPFASTAAFTANRYLTSNIILIGDTEVYSTGTTITGAESGLLTPGWVGTPTVGGLTASVAEYISGATLPPTAANVDLLKVRLSAGATAVNVTGLVFHRTGVGATTDWTSMAVYADGVRLVSSGRTISSDTNDVEFPTLDISIPANSSKVISLRGTVSNPGTTGGRHAFSLKTVTTAATVTGLPVSGNEFVIGVTGGSTVTVAAGTSISNPTIGAQAAEIASFKLTAGANDIDFKEVVLTLSGSLARSSATNLKLYQEGTLLATAASVASNDTVTFTLATPFTITKGNNRIFTVKADLAGRVAETLTVKVDDVDHLVAIDKISGYGAAVSGPSISVGSITMQGGVVSIADNGPTASYIGRNLQDVVLTKFSLTSGRNVEVKKLRVVLRSDGTNLIITNGITDLRIKDLDTGATVMSKSISTSNCVNADSCVTANADADTNRWDLTDVFNLSAGVTRHLAVTVDVGTSATLPTEYIRADVFAVEHTAATDYEFRDVNTGDYIKLADVIPTSITGDNQTIQASSLTVGAASTPVSQTVVKGASKVEALGVNLTAGNASDVKITQLQARVYVNTAATPTTGNGATEVTTPNANITSIYLYDGTTLLSTKTLSNTASTHDYGLVTFDNLNVNITKSATKKLTVKFDVSSQSAAVYTLTSVLGANITAYDGDSNVIDMSAASDANAIAASAANKIAITVSTTGTLTTAQDANTPVAGIVLAGNDNVVLAKIKFTAATEQFVVNKFRVKLNTATNDGSIDTVTISPEGGTAQTSSLTSGYANFSNVGWTIPADGTKVLTISAKLSTILSTIDATGRNLKIGVDGTTADVFEAVGTSQTVLSAPTNASDIYGNNMYLRATKPTVTLTALSNTILADGTMTLYKFNVAASTSGALTVKKLSFYVTPNDAGTGGALTLNTWKLYDYDDQSTALAGTWSNGTSTSTTGAISITAAKTMQIELTNEKEVGAGSTKSFILKAVVSNSTQYDSVLTSMPVSNDTSPLTGGLSDHDTELAQLDDGSTQSTVDFLWSDKAKGINHAETYQSTYMDWTNGYLVTGLPTDNQTLSR
ncbi:MAG: hypothetical protein PHV78_00435 [Patescibacteria group bacterium]|nr:hypothetical protein [Patescibacteria group bacterium]MDD5121361.1 hypothetical protein [Patescibacteria group bacterium]MDD5395720.1 hypothetical protein [Patescibacteria group bacterium]